MKYHKKRLMEAQAMTEEQWRHRQLFEQDGDLTRAETIEKLQLEIKRIESIPDEDFRKEHLANHEREQLAKQQREQLAYQKWAILDDLPF